MRIAIAALALASCQADVLERAPAEQPPVAAVAERFAVQQAGWTATPLMITARWSHTATLLLDGRVLLAGGTATAARVSAEIYDPRAGTWTPTGGDMPTPHSDHVAARLCDGRVLVAGGFSSDGSASITAAIYDPVADTWTAAKPMHYGHTYGTATLLAGSCRVLVAGGYTALNRSEVYDPAADQWTLSSGGLSQTRFYATATALQDGRVVVAGGGYDQSNLWYTLPNVDAYDPGTGKWSLLASLHARRRSHAATLLPDGRIVVTGGSDGGQDDGAQAAVELASIEVYDPAARAWTVAPPLAQKRTAHTATLLDNGAVLVAGGIDDTGSALSSAVAWHDGAFSATPPMTRDRYHHTATLLGDGSVLVAGGQHQATAEIYRLDGTGAPCQSPDACASGACVDGVCCDAPCADACSRCDVPGAAGTCASPCLDATHAAACPGGSGACADVAACGAVSCAPYLCTAAARGCAASCSSVEDCAPGFACSAGGQCLAPPAAVDGDPGACGLGPRLSGGRAKEAALALLAVACALGLRARGRPRGAIGGSSRARGGWPPPRWPRRRR